MTGQKYPDCWKKEYISHFKIGQHDIADKSKTFIIAEIGNNHNGNINLAKQLVDLTIEAKADCVKFQMRDLQTLYSYKNKGVEAGYDLGSQYILDLLKRFQLTPDELYEVFDYSYSKGILPLCTPWDLTSLERLEQYGMEAYKLASADFTNPEMLTAVAKTGKPFICSTGMCTEAEIHSSVNLLRNLGAQFAVLHCNSTYPTPFKDVNLHYLPRLQQIAGTVVGYSGHERGIEIPLAAVALGARIIEKHLTLDHGMEGQDHKVSLLPNEFTEMVRQIRNVEEALGHQTERRLTQGELINRENLAKSLVINQPLKKGEVIKRNMIEVKSPGQGLQPNRIGELIGKIAQHDFITGEMFFESDLSERVIKKSHYCFTRPYGIPVRYHDYAKLTADIQLDFVEFHLSYHDLDINPENVFTDRQSISCAVHSPELFANDHIMNLASKDETYRDHSINELRRVVSITNTLRYYFPSTKKPILVVNVGGWSTKDFLPLNERTSLYEKVRKSLEQVDLSQTLLAIQTMPPFPWHFGGQSYHNLFVDPDEIATFCEKTGHKVCLDISHSMMACNFYKWNFTEFLEKVLPYTVHLHIADSLGVDGEGIPMGRGDINFRILKEHLKMFAPGIPFIPEVWQGHKNKGEGFWSALEFLEKTGV